MKKIDLAKEFEAEEIPYSFFKKGCGTTASFRSPKQDAYNTLVANKNFLIALDMKAAVEEVEKVRSISSLEHFAIVEPFLEKINLEVALNSNYNSGLRMIAIGASAVHLVNIISRYNKAA